MFPGGPACGCHQRPGGRRIPQVWNTDLQDGVTAQLSCLTGGMRPIRHDDADPADCRSKRVQTQNKKYNSLKKAKLHKHKPKCYKQVPGRGIVGRSGLNTGDHCPRPAQLILHDFRDVSDLLKKCV